MFYLPHSPSPRRLQITQYRRSIDPLLTRMVGPTRSSATPLAYFVHHYDNGGKTGRVKCAISGGGTICQRHLAKCAGDLTRLPRAASTEQGPHAFPAGAVAWYIGRMSNLPKGTPPCSTPQEELGFPAGWEIPTLFSLRLFPPPLHPLLHPLPSLTTS